MVALVATGVALALPAVAQPPSGPRATVTGTVFDSIGRKPIAGANIELVSGESPTARPFTATSDASGRFSIDGVPFGRYLAGFFHVSLDSLGLEAAPRQVDVRVSSQKIDLAVCFVGARMLWRIVRLSQKSGAPGKGRVVLLS